MCIHDGMRVSVAPEANESNPEAMGTGFWSCNAAPSINGPLGIHGKNKCNEFSGLSQTIT